MALRKSQKGSVAARVREQAKRQRRIDAYRDAYRLANGDPVPDVTYDRGWYRLRSMTVRGVKLDEMRDVLLTRAGAKGPTDG